MKIGTFITFILISTSLMGCSKPVVKSYWPKDELDAWINKYHVVEDDIPSIDEGIFEGQEMIEPSLTYHHYFMIEANDEGVNGVDAYEDKYYQILSEKGWTLDSSSYDISGYRASGPNETVFLDFLTLDGEFTLWIYPYNQEAMLG